MFLVNKLASDSEEEPSIDEKREPHGETDEHDGLIGERYLGARLLLGSRFTILSSLNSGQAKKEKHCSLKSVMNRASLRKMKNSLAVPTNSPTKAMASCFKPISSQNDQTLIGKNSDFEMQS